MISGRDDKVLGDISRTRQDLLDEGNMLSPTIKSVKVPPGYQLLLHYDGLDGSEASTKVIDGEDYLNEDGMLRCQNIADTDFTSFTFRRI